MQVAGLKFNLVNVWALPLIIGSAAEYGVNIVLRSLESRAHGGGPRLARSTVMGGGVQRPHDHRRLRQPARRAPSRRVEPGPAARDRLHDDADRLAGGAAHARAPRRREPESPAVDQSLGPHIETSESGVAIPGSSAERNGAGSVRKRIFIGSPLGPRRSGSRQAVSSRSDRARLSGGTSRPPGAKAARASTARTSPVQRPSGAGTPSSATHGFRTASRRGCP